MFQGPAARPLHTPGGGGGARAASLVMHTLRPPSCRCCSTPGTHRARKSPGKMRRRWTGTSAASAPWPTAWRPATGCCASGMRPSPTRWGQAWGSSGFVTSGVRPLWLPSRCSSGSLHTPSHALPACLQGSGADACVTFLPLGARTRRWWTSWALTWSATRTAGRRASNGCVSCLCAWRRRMGAGATRRRSGVSTGTSSCEWPPSRGALGCAWRLRPVQVVGGWRQDAQYDCLRHVCPPPAPRRGAPGRHRYKALEVQFLLGLETLHQNLPEVRAPARHMWVRPCLPAPPPVPGPACVQRLPTSVAGVHAPRCALHTIDACATPAAPSHVGRRWRCVSCTASSSCSTSRPWRSCAPGTTGESVSAH